MTGTSATGRRGAPLIDPPGVLDGARVSAVAYLAAARATGSVCLYRDGQRQGGDELAYVAVAAYDDCEACYVFYCDDAWEVQNDMAYHSREDAAEQLQHEFAGLVMRDV